MGEAKKRGTRDERIAQAVERERVRDEEAAARRRAHNEREMARLAEIRQRDPGVIVIRPERQPRRHMMSASAVLGVALATLIKK